MPHGVGTNLEDDGNCIGCGFGREGPDVVRRYGDLAMDEVNCHSGQPIGLILPPAIFDQNITAVEKPASLSPRRNAATRLARGSNEPPWRNPMTGIAGCCARAAIGHAAAAPLSSVMNSRRFSLDHLVGAAGHDWIGTRGSDNSESSGAGRRLGRKCRRKAEQCDHRYLTPNQVRGERRQSIIVAIRPAVFDRHVSSLGVASCGEAIAERCHKLCRRIFLTPRCSGTRSPASLACCPRAASGHAAAAPPSSVMNSRRLVCRERSIVRGDGGWVITRPP